MDADLSHNPSELINFINNLEIYPFVIGSRYISGGKCLMKKRRLLLSKFGNILIKSVLGINCNEFTTSYRGFNLKKLNNFDIYSVNSQGYSFFMETIYRIHKLGCSIKQVPIIFADRTKGVSKIPKIEILRTLKNLLIVLQRHGFRKKMRSQDRGLLVHHYLRQDGERPQTPLNTPRTT